MFAVKKAYLRTVQPKKLAVFKLYGFTFGGTVWYCHTSPRQASSPNIADPGSPNTSMYNRSILQVVSQFCFVSMTLNRRGDRTTLLVKLNMKGSSGYNIQRNMCRLLRLKNQQQECPVRMWLQDLYRKLYKDINCCGQNKSANVYKFKLTLPKYYHQQQWS